MYNIQNNVQYIFNNNTENSNYYYISWEKMSNKCTVLKFKTVSKN